MAASNWVLEIDCKTDRNVVRYAVAPTKPTTNKHPHAETRRFEHLHPQVEEGPFFQARILVRDQKIQDRDVLDLSAQTSGVRVYMEGFRVLPYGDSGDDWLGINASYTRRSKPTDPVFADMVAGEDDPDRWQLLVLPNKSYTGAVFLTQDDAPTLRMLVNREGFADERALDTLIEIVKRGIDLLTRTRAAATLEDRQRQRHEHAHARQPFASPPSASLPIAPSPQRSLTETSATAMETVRETRRLLATNADLSLISQRLEITQTAIAQVAAVAAATDRALDKSAMLRVLASLGTQMAGFVHEIRGLLGTAIAIHEAVERLRADQRISGESRSKLNPIYQSLGDLRRQIERQAAYLIDLTSTDARRRRSRQRLAERFDAAVRLIAASADRREIRLLNEIPIELKTPPMFPAEVMSVFSNLLTNAVKATGDRGEIRVRGWTRPDGGVVLAMENTGVAVNLADSDRCFLPFELTTAEMDSVLGYGMGLGLTITRDILEQYDASIRFVAPSEGYATAIQIQFPGDKESASA